MKNEVTRRQFLKGSLAATAMFGLGLGVNMEKSHAGLYTPGTYSAVSKGMESEVTVTMTFDADSITDVQIDVSGETPAIGGRIGDTMAEAISSAQSWDVDAVSGATVSSEAIRKAAKKNRR